MLSAIPSSLVQIIMNLWGSYLSAAQCLPSRTQSLCLPHVGRLPSFSVSFNVLQPMKGWEKKAACYLCSCLILSLQFPLSALSARLFSLPPCCRAADNIILNPRYNLDPSAVPSFISESKVSHIRWIPAGNILPQPLCFLTIKPRSICFLLSCFL